MSRLFLIPALSVLLFTLVGCGGNQAVITTEDEGVEPSDAFFGPDLPAEDAEVFKLTVQEFSDLFKTDTSKYKNAWLEITGFASGPDILEMDNGEYAAAVLLKAKADSLELCVPMRVRDIAEVQKLAANAPTTLRGVLWAATSGLYVVDRCTVVQSGMQPLTGPELVSSFKADPTGADIKGKSVVLTGKILRLDEKEAFDSKDAKLILAGADGTEIPIVEGMFKGQFDAAKVGDEVTVLGVVALPYFDESEAPFAIDGATNLGLMK